MTQTKMIVAAYLGDDLLCFLPYGNARDVGLKRANRHIYLVDFGPPDRNQMHLINSEPSIALVKSNSCNLFLHSANERATRGWPWTL